MDTEDYLFTQLLKALRGESLDAPRTPYVPEDKLWQAFVQQRTGPTVPVNQNGFPLVQPPRGMLPVDPAVVAKERQRLHLMENATRSAAGRAYGMEGKSIAEIVDEYHRLQRARAGTD